MTTDTEITGDVYRDCLNRVWVRTWQGWESASEPAIRKSIASIPGLVELVPVTEFVPVIDYDGGRVLFAPNSDGTEVVQFWRDETDGHPPANWPPLFRRVTEPAGSVTP